MGPPQMSEPYYCCLLLGTGTHHITHRHDCNLQNPRTSAFPPPRPPLLIFSLPDTEPTYNGMKLRDPKTRAHNRPSPYAAPCPATDKLITPARRATSRAGNAPMPAQPAGGSATDKDDPIGPGGHAQVRDPSNHEEALACYNAALALPPQGPFPALLRADSFGRQGGGHGLRLPSYGSYTQVREGDVLAEYYLEPDLFSSMEDCLADATDKSPEYCIPVRRGSADGRHSNRAYMRMRNDLASPSDYGGRLAQFANHTTGNSNCKMRVKAYGIGGVRTYRVFLVATQEIPHSRHLRYHYNSPLATGCKGTTPRDLYPNLKSGTKPPYVHTIRRREKIRINKEERAADDAVRQVQRTTTRARRGLRPLRGRRATQGAAVADTSTLTSASAPSTPPSSEDNSCTTTDSTTEDREAISVPYASAEYSETPEATPLRLRGGGDNQETGTNIVTLLYDDDDSNGDADADNAADATTHPGLSLEAHRDQAAGTDHADVSRMGYVTDTTTPAYSGLPFVVAYDTEGDAYIINTTSDMLPKMKRGATIYFEAAGGEPRLAFERLCKPGINARPLLASSLQNTGAGAAPLIVPGTIQSYNSKSRSGIVTLANVYGKSAHKRFFTNRMLTPTPSLAAGWPVLVGTNTLDIGSKADQLYIDIHGICIDPARFDRLVPCLPPIGFLDFLRGTCGVKFDLLLGGGATTSDPYITCPTGQALHFFPRSTQNKKWEAAHWRAMLEHTKQALGTIVAGLKTTDDDYPYYVSCNKRLRRSLANKKKHKLHIAIFLPALAPYFRRGTILASVNRLMRDDNLSFALGTVTIIDAIDHQATPEAVLQVDPQFDRYTTSLGTTAVRAFAFGHVYCHFWNPDAAPPCFDDTASDQHLNLYGLQFASAGADSDTLPLSAYNYDEADEGAEDRSVAEDALALDNTLLVAWRVDHANSNTVRALLDTWPDNIAERTYEVTGWSVHALTLWDSADRDKVLDTLAGPQVNPPIIYGSRAEHFYLPHSRSFRLLCNGVGRESDICALLKDHAHFTITPLLSCRTHDVFHVTVDFDVSLVYDILSDANAAAYTANVPPPFWAVTIDSTTHWLRNRIGPAETIGHNPGLLVLHGIHRQHTLEACLAAARACDPKTSQAELIRTAQFFRSEKRHSPYCLRIHVPDMASALSVPSRTVQTGSATVTFYPKPYSDKSLPVAGPRLTAQRLDPEKFQQRIAGVTDLSDTMRTRLSIFGKVGSTSPAFQRLQRDKIPGHKPPQNILAPHCQTFGVPPGFPPLKLPKDSLLSSKGVRGPTKRQAPRSQSVLSDDDDSSDAEDNTSRGDNTAAASMEVEDQGDPWPPTDFIRLADYISSHVPRDKNNALHSAVHQAVHHFRSGGKLHEIQGLTGLGATIVALSGGKLPTIVHTVTKVEDFLSRLQNITSQTSTPCIFDPNGKGSDWCVYTVSVTNGFQGVSTSVAVYEGDATTTKGFEALQGAYNSATHHPSAQQDDCGRRHSYLAYYLLLGANHRRIDSALELYVPWEWDFALLLCTIILYTDMGDDGKLHKGLPVLLLAQHVLTSAKADFVTLLQELLDYVLPDLGWGDSEPPAAKRHASNAPGRPVASGSGDSG